MRPFCVAVQISLSLSVLSIHGIVRDFIGAYTVSAPAHNVRVKVQRSLQLPKGMAGGGKADLSELFAAHRGIVSEKITERKVVHLH